ncbi:hypothetical protein D3C81_1226140 [compost metagenome]
MVSPLSRSVDTACSPELMPTMATNAASPKSFSSWHAAVGMAPNILCLDRAQPNTRPDSSAPPPAPSVSGIEPMRQTSRPISRPTSTPAPK